MDLGLLILGLIVLYVLIKLLKWPIKLMINGVLGVIILYVVNLVGASFGIHIAINIITALIAGIFGVPGVVVLLIFTFL